MVNKPDNMRPDDWESVAHHLDGRAGRLDGHQTNAADEIRRDEAWLGSMLDVSVPEDVLDRAYQRLDESLADVRGREPRSVRFWTLAAGAAVAAGVAIVVLLNALVVPVSPPPDGLVSAEEAVTEYLQEETSALDLQLAMLDDEVILTWAEVLLDEEFGETSAIDPIADDLDALWFADPFQSADEYEL